MILLVNRELISLIYVFILLIVVNCIYYLINSFNMNNFMFLHLFYLKVNFTVVFIIVNISFNI